jgi:hypothetical protein
MVSEKIPTQAVLTSVPPVLLEHVSKNIVSAMPS